MNTAQVPDDHLPLAFRALVEGHPPIEPVALVVAHPDDEVIGVGGQLARWSRNLLCVYATDGAPADGADARWAGFPNRAAYAQARAAESRDALDRAGIGANHIHTLGFADQELVFALTKLDAAIERLLAQIRPAIVITHAFEGGHPDHDALALVLATLVARRRARNEHAPLLVEFAGYWEDASGALITNRFASPAMGGERQLRMSIPHRQQKDTLMACFQTQQRVLHSFNSRQEWIRPAPAYDFRALPNQGRVWYERFHWAVSGEEWLRLSAAYLDRTPTHGPLRLVC